MAKKVFLRREREVPTATVPSIRAEQSTLSATRDTPVFESRQVQSVSQVRASTISGSSWIELLQQRELATSSFVRVGESAPSTSSGPWFESPQQRELPSVPPMQVGEGSNSEVPPPFQILAENSKLIKKIQRWGAQ
jgi:hypothetical protein